MSLDKKETLSDVEPGLAPSIPSSVDDNYDTYKRNTSTEITEKEAKHVLRKIDRRIVPILFVTYMLQYLDKNGINYASVYGLDEGTQLTGQDYSWLGVYPVTPVSMSL